MKNLMLLLIIAVIAYGAWQYNTPNQELIDAKKELGIEVDTSTDSTINDAKKEIFKQVDNAVDEAKEVVEDLVEDVIEEDKPTFIIEELTDNAYLELNSIKESDLLDGEVELTGKTLSHVDKIRVLYTNKDSDYPDDDFTLKKFKAGDAEFLYRAFSRYETFDYGTNIYTFFAYSGTEVAKTELTIYYPNPENSTQTDNQESINEVDHTIDSTQLPTSGDYGSPVKLGENKFTYSDIKGFQVEKHSVLGISCNSDLVTKTIGEKTSSWSWWNTCRPSSDESYVTYYALNMKDGNYTYAKHYFSTNYYAITELSTGVDEGWNTLESVAEKNEWLKNNNNEFKTQNDSFELTKITDTLFENIINK